MIFMIEGINTAKLIYSTDKSGKKLKIYCKIYKIQQIVTDN